MDTLCVWLKNLIRAAGLASIFMLGSGVGIGVIFVGFLIFYYESLKNEVKLFLVLFLYYVKLYFLTNMLYFFIVNCNWDKAYAIGNEI